MTSDLSSRPLMITGASGFVGHHLLQALQANGYQQEKIVAVVSKERDVVASCTNLRVLDITDRAATHKLIADIRPRGIVHLAAIAEPAQARRDHAQAWRVNFHGTMNIADAVLEHVPDARLIFAGTSEAYGDSFNLISGAITESAALRPMSTYAATKAAADMMLGQMAYDGLVSVRFRAFNHTGCGQGSAYVVSSFAHQLARISVGQQEPVISVGNLEARRDFLDVRDVVDAYVRAVDVDLGGPGDHVFNLASGKARSIQSILDDLIVLAGMDVDVRQDPDRMRATDVAQTIGDSARARTVLGFATKISFEQTLSDVLTGWQEQIASSS